MSPVLHLMRHDLRTNVTVVSAWVTLMLVQVPLGFLIASGRLEPYSESVGLALPVMRLALMALLIAALVQADAPSGDRTFWRSRPIPPRSMTLAKTGLIAALCFGAPLAIVLLEAVWLRVPLSHVPTIVIQVVMLDGAVVGLMVLVATLTRRVASMVLALVAAGGCLFLLVSLAGGVLRSAAVRRAYDAAPQKAEDVLPVLGVLLALTTWTMTLYAWRRAMDRRGLVILGGAGLAAGAMALAVPSLHATNGAHVVAGRPAHVGNGTLEARVAATGGSITLLAPLELEGLPREVAGTISVRDGELQAEGRRLPITNGVTWYDGLEPKLWVATVAPQEFAAVAGRRARVVGTISVDVKEHGRLGRLVLRRGEVLALDGLRLEVTDLAGSDASSIGRLAVTWTQPDLGSFSWRQTEFFRSSEGGARARVVAAPAYVRRSVDGAMLPTLAMPFGFRYVTLGSAARPYAAPQPGAEPWLDVEGPVRRTRGVWRLAADVRVPAAPTVAPPVPERLRVPE